MLSTISAVLSIQSIWQAYSTRDRDLLNLGIRGEIDLYRILFEING
jgi:hypothetical protein